MIIFLNTKLQSFMVVFVKSTHQFLLKSVQKCPVNKGNRYQEGYSDAGRGDSLGPITQRYLFPARMLRPPHCQPDQPTVRSATLYVGANVRSGEHNPATTSSY